MSSQKVLLLDIETSPIVVYVWGLMNQFIRSSQIKQDWRILCYTAKWLDSNKVIYEEARKDKHEKRMLKGLWKLLDTADVIITQNGTIFDAKRINSRLIYFGFPPPSTYRHYDLYRLTKRVADFTSKSLAYLTDNLCRRHKKLAHSKYAGMKLWVECLAQNNDAWKEMRKYNVEDVLSMEELYIRLRAWAPESFPKIFNLSDSDAECSTCGHVGQMRLGKPRKAKKYWYRQDSCPKCGAWQSPVKVRGGAK